MCCAVVSLFFSCSTAVVDTSQEGHLVTSHLVTPQDRTQLQQPQRSSEIIEKEVD